MAYKQTYRNAWLQTVEQYFAATTALPGEQLELDGLPEPPSNRLARALVFQLHYYADPSGGSIRPSYTRLARVNTCSVDSVRRAMQTLEKCGLVARMGPAYRGHAQLWRMTVPAWMALPKRVAGVQPFSGERVAGGTKKGGTRATPPFPLKGDGPYAASDAPSGARVATAAKTALARCAPADDGSGITCTNCNLPLAHPRHRGAATTEAATR